MIIHVYISSYFWSYLVTIVWMTVCNCVSNAAAACISNLLWTESPCGCLISVSCFDVMHNQELIMTFITCNTKTYKKNYSSTSESKIWNRIHNHHITNYFLILFRIYQIHCLNFSSMQLWCIHSLSRIHACMCTPVSIVLIYYFTLIYQLL